MLPSGGDGKLEDILLIFSQLGTIRYWRSRIDTHLYMERELRQLDEDNGYEFPYDSLLEYQLKVTRLKDAAIAMMVDSYARFKEANPRFEINPDSPDVIEDTYPGFISDDLRQQLHSCILPYVEIEMKAGELDARADVILILADHEARQDHTFKLFYEGQMMYVREECLKLRTSANDNITAMKSHNEQMWKAFQVRLEHAIEVAENYLDEVQDDDF